MSGITMVVKKIVIDILTEPEKLIKYVFFGIILPLLCILLIFALPIILVLNIPSLLLSSTSPDVTNKQIETIALYQEAPVIINERNLEWISKQESEYSWCDDIVITYNYDLIWQHLISIDSVILEQEFTKANSTKIIDLADKFMIRNTSVQTYIEIEQYEEEEDYEVDIEVVDPKTGKKSIKTVTRTRTVIKTREVTKDRAIISVTTKSFEQVLSQLGLSANEKDIATNIFRNIQYTDVEGNLNIYDDVDLSDLKEYPSGNANIPYFNQADKRWGAYSYGNSTIKSGGCGPTSLAMVVSGLKGRTDINPKIVADWSYSNGHRAEGQGSYWSLMTAGAKNYGLKVEAVSRKNPKAIVKALSEGYPIIVSMGRGHFTNGGHFIVLRGLTSDGKILVYDSASVERSKKAWDLGIIMNESSTNGGLNGNPFWIFRP